MGGRWKLLLSAEVPRPTNRNPFQTGHGAIEAIDGTTAGRVETAKIFFNQPFSSLVKTKIAMGNIHPFLKMYLKKLEKVGFPIARLVYFPGEKSGFLTESDSCLVLDFHA